MSILLPSLFTVLDIPPTKELSSSTKGLMSVCLSSSRAAVNPAGPAPIITAVFPIIRQVLKTRNLLARKFQKNTIPVETILDNM